jgi:hypothetical protein
MQKKEIIFYYYITSQVLIPWIINLQMETKPIHDTLFYCGGSFEKYVQRT